jgi:hypothetical protein
MACSGGCYQCNCDGSEDIFEPDYSKPEFPQVGVDYKFNEDMYLEELRDYIDKTYSGHYSQNKFQTTEIIIERGRGTGFCMGNVDKYSNRYGKKGTRDDHRKDLMKILHFTILQLYIHDNDKG